MNRTLPFRRKGFIISKMHMKIILSIVIIFAVICLISCIIDTHRFVIRRYTVTSPKVRRDTRFILLADLHDKDYGDNNRKLIEAIVAEHPDAIIAAGDILNGLAGHRNDHAFELIKSLAGRYPIYYGLGNHEYRLKIYPEQYGPMWDDYASRLDGIGIHVMDNERAVIGAAGIDIAAVTVDRRFYKRFESATMNADIMNEYVGKADTGAFQLLIAHNPEYFRTYAEWGADLTVSGHVHGGIMRLPFIGGIISPRLFSFPRYSGGEYEYRGHKLIVSCGLGTHSIHVRVFNPAELSVIDVKGTTG